MLTDEQRKLRKNGIGASDSPIIMGYSRFKSPYQLYLEKKGLLETDEVESELQYWGNALEPLIIKRFSELNEVEVTFPDTIHHPEFPYIFANLDGYIPEWNAVLEVKCANSFQRFEWDKALEDGIPLNYLIQIAKQVAIMDAEKGYCAVLIGGYDYLQFTYERDRALEELIINSDIKFWENLQAGIEPDAINTFDCRLKYKSPRADKQVLSTFATSTALAELMGVKDQMKRFAEYEDRYKMKIMMHMGDAEYLVGLNEEVLATWKANKKGVRVLNIK